MRENQRQIETTDRDIETKRKRQTEWVRYKERQIDRRITRNQDLNPTKADN